jgi:excinuclease ABC subunit C
VYLGEVRSAMLEAAGRRDFEQAAALRDTLRNLHDTIKQRTRIGKTPALQADEARKGLDELRELLLLNKTPHVIEAFDISNISGTLAVGGMVCAVEGVPRPQRYRQFRIRTRQQPDDPGMMAEVILRRYRRLLNEKAPLPDLVLVDGGITQVRAAMRSLRELGLSKLDVVGLAKRLEEMIRDRDGGPRAFVLPRDSQALQIFTRLRDEAHRFALTYHRKLRMRRIRESQLDDIPGIGNKRKQQLLAHFGSVARLRKATEEEITAVPGFGVKTARLIMRHIAE